MPGRKSIPQATQQSILTKSRRRCCLCFWLDHVDETAAGQLAHLDQNHENPAEDNLAFLCLKHHDEYDATTSQSKGFQEKEVRYWRDKLYAEMDQRTASFVPSTGAGHQITGNTGHVVVGDGNSVSINAPKAEPDPIIQVNAGLTQHAYRGPVSLLCVTVQNTSSRSIFIGNIFLEAGGDLLFVKQDYLGEPQQKREIRPGDSYNFAIDSLDLKNIGRPAGDYVCAIVNDAVGKSHKSDPQSFRLCIEHVLRPHVQFDDRFIWDVDSDTYCFVATIDGKRTMCGVTLEALVSGFCVPRDELQCLDSIVRYRPAIHSIAKQLIERGQKNPQGRYIVMEENVKTFFGAK